MGQNDKSRKKTNKKNQITSPHSPSSHNFTQHISSYSLSMSTASKITLGASIAFATGAFIFINYSQQSERAALRQGPIKDAERQQAKLQKTQKQQANELEHREQEEMKRKFAALQPLSGEIIRGEPEGGNAK